MHLSPLPPRAGGFYNLGKGTVPWLFAGAVRIELLELGLLRNSGLRLWSVAERATT